MPPLSERDMRLLDFKRGIWRSAGAKEQAIAEAARKTPSNKTGGEGGDPCRPMKSVT